MHLFRKNTASPLNRDSRFHHSFYYLFYFLFFIFLRILFSDFRCLGSVFSTKTSSLSFLLLCVMMGFSIIAHYRHAISLSLSPPADISVFTSGSCLIYFVLRCPRNISRGSPSLPFTFSTVRQTHLCVCAYAELEYTCDCVMRHTWTTSWLNFFFFLCSLASNFVWTALINLGKQLMRFEGAHSANEFFPPSFFACNIITAGGNLWKMRVCVFRCVRYWRVKIPPTASAVVYFIVVCKYFSITFYRPVEMLPASSEMEKRVVCYPPLRFFLLFFIFFLLLYISTVYSTYRIFVNASCVTICR